MAVPETPAPPAWLASVQLVLDRNANIALESRHPAGILFATLASEEFALTFGHAWSALKSEWIDCTFGLRVALNAIPRDQLTELKAEQVFAAWHLANERSPKPTSLTKFGLESDRDLVHAVEGRPSAALAPILGSSIRGGTSLKVSLDFSKLKDGLVTIDSLQKKTDYQSMWPEIDNMVLVRDVSISMQLDATLDAALKTTSVTTPTILLVAPTLKRTEVAPPSAYVIGRLPSKPKHGSRPSAPFLLIGNWLAYLRTKRQTPSLSTALDTAVHLLDENGDVLDQRRLYDCICFEASLVTGSTRKNYVLSAGAWYEASSGFIQRINRELSSLASPSSHPLQTWNGSDVEGIYNKSCIRTGLDLYLFDAKNVHFGGGQSKFEFCDLFHLSGKTLYFVKHVGASNHLSHLTEQVRRTVELVFGPDGAFRSKLSSQIKSAYPGIDTSWLEPARPRQGDLHLCLVSMGRHFNDYPFFAKCGLSRLVRELRRENHSVSFLKV